MLIGSQLEFNSSNLLNPDSQWIAVVQCSNRLGLLPTVCKAMSVDLQLEQMRKRKNDVPNVVVLEIKGAHCEGEPAVGICFPEDQDSCVVPGFLMAPNGEIVQLCHVFRKGVFGCDCSVSESFKTHVTLSLVSNGLCVENELTKMKIEMFLQQMQVQIGGCYNIELYEKQVTENDRRVHVRVDSLKELKGQLVEKLWKRTGPDGDQLKKATNLEFVRRESSVWRSGGKRGSGSKRYKIMESPDSLSSLCVKVRETMHGPTSFLLNVQEGSVAHTQFLNTKNMLLADAKKICTLVPDQSFFPKFIKDMKDYVICLEQMRRKE